MLDMWCNPLSRSALLTVSACVSQGYSGQYDGYMNGHEAAIDQAEMAARGMMQQGTGELSNQSIEANVARCLLMLPCCP